MWTDRSMTEAEGHTAGPGLLWRRGSPGCRDPSLGTRHARLVRTTVLHHILSTAVAADGLGGGVSRRGRSGDGAVIKMSIPTRCPR